MDVRSDIFQSTPDGFHLHDVSVRLARPDERRRWDALMDQHHYLGFKRFAGLGLRYVFEWRGDWLGLAGWQSAPLSAARGPTARLEAEAPVHPPTPDCQQYPFSFLMRHAASRTSLPLHLPQWLST